MKNLTERALKENEKLFDDLLQAVIIISLLVIGFFIGYTQAIFICMGLIP